MNVSKEGIALPRQQAFQADTVLALTAGHLVHDTFASFLAPLLPLIIERLGLSMTLAGSLAAIQSLPSLLNPFLGLLADRVSLRWFAILAPTITASAMSLIGIAPSYGVIVLLLLLAGFSSATWHVPTPVVIARASGRHVGRGMSVFMLGGELSRFSGPLLAVSAVTWWGLGGPVRLIPLGVLVSVLIYWRLQDVVARPIHRADDSWLAAWRDVRWVMGPVAGISLARAAMAACLGTFLPIFLSQQGATLWQAGSGLSVIGLAAALGALVGGALSDRIGRRKVVGFVLLAAPLLMLLFLSVKGWVIYPVLLLMGFIFMSTGPVLLALVQDNGNGHPATANGLYMALQFMGQSLVVILVGVIADRWGLPAAFRLSGFMPLLGLPFLLMLRRPRPVNLSGKE